MTPSSFIETNAASMWEHVPGISTAQQALRRDPFENADAGLLVETRNSSMVCPKFVQETGLFFIEAKKRGLGRNHLAPCTTCIFIVRMCFLSSMVCPKFVRDIGLFLIEAKKRSWAESIWRPVL